LVPLLFGCSGGGSDDAAPSTTRAPSPTTTAAPAEDDVLSAYRGFWDAYLAAADPMDPGHPDLARFATGASLDRVRSSFTEHFERGEVIRGSVDLAPAVEQVTDSTANLRDCYLDQTHVFDSATGKQVDPPGEATFEIVVTLQLVDGGWKVATLDKVADGCEH
jgi:hypothetical protein